MSKVTERKLQNWVIKLAEAKKYLVYHTHDSRHSQKGFPDLVMVKNKRVLFVELKSEDGTTTPEQKVWLKRLRWAEMEVGVWRPRHWSDGSIERVLNGDHLYLEFREVE